MNSRCSEFRDRLEPYLDGELEESSAREIERHLEECPACRSALEEMRTTDRLLREGLAGEEIDDERCESSLSETLDRIRQEPSPAWERRRPAQRRSLRFDWNWRLRWLAGVAAATAAVFLALRLGPEPMAPEKPKSIPHRQTEQTAREEKGSSIPITEAPVADVEPADAAGETYVAKPAPAPEPRPNGLDSETAGQKPAGYLEEVIPAAPAVELKREETRDEMLLEGEKSAPGIRGGRSEPPPTGAPSELVPAAEKRGSRSRESAPERMLLADTPSSAHATARGGTTAEASIWEIAADDTLGPAAKLQFDLEIAALRLRATRADELTRGERARRWRTIGNLWEWIGRQEDSPAAFANALDAYRTAAEIDPEAAGLDSTRVRRARARSAEEIEGNILPAER